MDCKNLYNFVFIVVFDIISIVSSAYVKNNIYIFIHVMYYLKLLDNIFKPTPALISLPFLITKNH